MIKYILGFAYIVIGLAIGIFLEARRVVDFDKRKKLCTVQKNVKIVNSNRKEVRLKNGKKRVYYLNTYMDNDRVYYNKLARCGKAFGVDEKETTILINPFDNSMFIHENEDKPDERLLKFLIICAFIVSLIIVMLFVEAASGINPNLTL